MHRKIFGIGLSRTGTSSLAAALQILGISCIHAPAPHLIEVAQSLVDAPAAARFQELDVLYPGSKFILTVREIQGWLQSCQQHWDRVPLSRMHPHARLEFGWCRVKLFGTPGFDVENHEQSYYRHLYRVGWHFRKRPDDLLVFNVIAGEGWEPLCRFLGVPIPPIEFPWKNRASSDYFAGPSG